MILPVQWILTRTTCPGTETTSARKWPVFATPVPNLSICDSRVPLHPFSIIEPLTVLCANLAQSWHSFGVRVNLAIVLIESVLLLIHRIRLRSTRRPNLLFVLDSVHSTYVWYRLYVFAKKLPYHELVNMYDMCASWWRRDSYNTHLSYYASMFLFV